jgi:hypothetical protein
LTPTQSTSIIAKSTLKSDATISTIPVNSIIQMPNVKAPVANAKRLVELKVSYDNEKTDPEEAEELSLMRNVKDDNFSDHMLMLLLWILEDVETDFNVERGIGCFPLSKVRKLNPFLDSLLKSKSAEIEEREEEERLEYFNMIQAMRQKEQLAEAAKRARMLARFNKTNNDSRSNNHDNDEDSDIEESLQEKAPDPPRNLPISATITVNEWIGCWQQLWNHQGTPAIEKMWVEYAYHVKIRRRRHKHLRPPGWQSASKSADASDDPSFLGIVFDKPFEDDRNISTQQKKKNVK